MIIDTSAIVASLLDEVEAERVGRTIARARSCRVGAPTLVEATMVLSGKRGPTGRSLLGRFIQEKNLDVLSLTEAHWRIAQDAFVRYGKGRHPATLNFGDCLTYATASIAREPLLCVGDDFPQTDLELVDLVSA